MSAVFAFCPPHLAEAREFTSSSGKVLIADIVFVAGNTATLKRPDGKTVDVPLKMFSEDDQKFILEGRKRIREKFPST